MEANLPSIPLQLLQGREFGFKKKSTSTDVSKNPYGVHANASCKKCSVWFSLSAAEELCVYRMTYICHATSTFTIFFSVAKAML
jgi:hypothetical protein